ncbi:MAG: twin-arginine translocase TatA/TatE family subunit [Opitutales bacterium]
MRLQNRGILDYFITMNYPHEPILAMLNGMEMILIGLVLLLLFGAKRLPELFRSMGRATKEFQKARSEVEDDIRTVMDQEPETTIDHQATEHQATEHQATEHQDEETHSETVSEPEKKRT